jgi:hypothetical protein
VRGFTVILLAVCVIVVGAGILTGAASPGFFMNLPGASMLATGGTARRAGGHLAPESRARNASLMARPEAVDGVGAGQAARA